MLALLDHRPDRQQHDLLAQVVQGQHGTVIPLVALGEDARLSGVEDPATPPAELGTLASEADQPPYPVEQGPGVALLGGDVDPLIAVLAAGENRAHQLLMSGRREAAVDLCGPL